MSNQNALPNFHPERHDRLLQERVHDPYRAQGKLSGPTVCPKCGAVFHEGRWQWLKAPSGARQECCPACRRIHDDYPCGFVTLQGEFFTAHRDEIMRLVRNEEKHEQAEHPLKRIMATEETKNGGALLSTTDTHLAIGIGEALQRAYRGELKFHYNPDEYLLRVNWSR